MNDEFNKGYLSPWGGPKSTYEEQRGADQAIRDRERERQQEIDRAEQRRREHERSMETAWKASEYPTTGSTGTRSTTLGSRTGTTSGPITIQSAMGGCALLGAIGGALYAGTSGTTAGWPSMVGGGLAGALMGTLAGVLLYAVVVVLRVAFEILAWVLRIAVIGGLLLGALYLVSQILEGPN